SAPPPLAVFWTPVVLVTSAWNPMAVLPLPVVLAASVVSPMAVLFLPVVLAASVATPMAVLFLPVVLLMSAFVPRLVLPTEPEHDEGRACAAATPARQSEKISAAIRTENNEAALLDWRNI